MSLAPDTTVMQDTDIQDTGTQDTKNQEFQSILNENIQNTLNQQIQDNDNNDISTTGFHGIQDSNENIRDIDNQDVPDSSEQNDDKQDIQVILNEEIQSSDNQDIQNNDNQGLLDNDNEDIQSNDNQEILDKHNQNIQNRDSRDDNNQDIKENYQQDIQDSGKQDIHNNVRQHIRNNVRLNIQDNDNWNVQDNDNQDIQVIAKQGIRDNKEDIQGNDKHDVQDSDHLNNSNNKSIQEIDSKDIEDTDSQDIQIPDSQYMQRPDSQYIQDIDNQDIQDIDSHDIEDTDSQDIQDTDSQDIQDNIDQANYDNDSQDIVDMGMLEAMEVNIVKDIVDMEEIQYIEMKKVETIINHINDCLVPKFAKNYDESEIHPETDIRNNNLDDKIKIVIEDLEKFDFNMSPDNEAVEYDHPYITSIISSLLILFKELLCSCSWNSDHSTECALKIDYCFNVKCGISLEDIFKENDVCDSQAVYDKSLDNLCKKLTSDDFKKYPGLIEVYCDLVQNVEELDVTVNSLKVFPVTLILMDDYIETNKSKGLLCCEVLLKNVTAEDFEDGNYYDVIYLSIQSTFNYNVIEVTELGLECTLQLCEILPLDVKDEKLDEIYTTALEHISTESNLYKKAVFFKFTKKIMEMLEIRCVANSMFKTVICDAIESCLNDSVAEILLIPSLECLEEWIKYCWPVWKLSVDFKVLCALLKYYSKCNTGEGGLLAQKLIVTLVSLCTPEEQKQFTIQLAGKDEDDNTKMDDLKKDIGVDTNVD